MALDFPNSPTNGQSVTLAGVVYVYDSSIPAWVAKSATGAVRNITVSNGAPSGGVNGDIHIKTV